MVFYLKYRPAKIDDLDSHDVRQTLKSVLASAEFPHAFLFTGPKGLGKTSSARIVAKVVNCITPPNKRKDNFEPCDKCGSCLSISNGSNMDILEIDAASNRGIDEIRDLKEKIRLAPVSSKKKVYIIDEVHMLTTEAFNALLKTLEEPPEHAMFILATTEAHKVPSTIISRCFNVKFKKADVDELVRSFVRIAKGENLQIDKNALEMIASMSDGSFRDGAKIINELISSGIKKITIEMIDEKFKFSSVNQNIKNFITHLKKKEVKNTLEIISATEKQGIDMKYFSHAIVEVLHNELLELLENIDLTEYNFQIEELKNLIILISGTINELKNTVLPQLPLELAVIDYCAISDNKTTTELDNDVNTLQSEDNLSGISKMRRAESNLKKVTAMYGNNKKNVKQVKDKIIDHSGISLLHTSNTEITAEWLKLFWSNLISEMKNHNHTIAGVLRGCRIEQFDLDNLVIETPFKFHKEKLDEVKTKGEIARISKVLTGRETIVEVQLKSK